jgi:serine/threonine-protein kinase
MAGPTPEFLDLQSALAGEYSLQRELGRGGMGVVYLARDVQLDRDVAIKVLPAHLAQIPASRERFLREARTAAGLSHPHIVPIHRVGEVGGFVFFVMTFVDGETLGERLRTRGPLPHADAARILREVAWALAYAHGRGIVHRDVKPDNILLEAGTGRAMVTDFGIAHGGTDAELTGDAGLIMGTANFMSPEQAIGDPVDARSDLYALGVVGYLTVSGRLPLEAANVPALIEHQASEVPVGVARVSPGIPPALASVIDRCLQRDPANRFPDGEALAAALAPTPDTRPALPPMLRAWLGARNPLIVPYMGWFGAFGALTLANLLAWVTGNRPAGFGDIPLLAGIASLPLLPIIGFHLNQARRQFLAGHTLADLRTALEIARREREETESLTRERDESASRKLLRIATLTAGGWLAVTFGLLLSGVIHENRPGPQILGVSLNMLLIFAPVLTTMLLGAISNALDVQFIPTAIRDRWQTGIRDRLWNSTIGKWIAKRLGAPEQSRAVGGGVFRATEVALGAAVSDLFAALPSAFRENLGELPDTVTALEANAAAARAELDIVAALAPSGSTDAVLLERRRSAATAHLSASVAALEGIRLDLLRLHAGASDLAPLTTLIESARRASDDVKRLADAQREVDDAMSPQTSTPTTGRPR